MPAYGGCLPGSTSCFPCSSYAPLPTVPFMSAGFCPYFSFFLEFPFFPLSGSHLSRSISSIIFLKPRQMVEPSRDIHSPRCLHCSQKRYVPWVNAIDFHLHWCVYRSVSPPHGEHLEGWDPIILLFNSLYSINVGWMGKGKNFQGTQCRVLYMINN